MSSKKHQWTFRMLAVMMSAAMMASAIAPMAVFAAPAADEVSADLAAAAKEAEYAFVPEIVMEEDEEAVSYGLGAEYEITELPELNQDNLAGIMEERLAAVKTDATVVPMLWQGLLEQKIKVGEETRTAKLYVPKDTPQGTSFILMNVPEGKDDTVKWLYESGWLTAADTLKLCLFVLEPGEGGWGSAEEEMAYIQAGYSAERTGVYLMPGPSVYIVGYGEVGSDLQKIAMANPLSVAAAAFVDANDIDDAYLEEMTEKSFDTSSKTYGVMYKDVPVPVMLVNGSEKLVEYWKGASKATELVSSENNISVWKQAEESEFTPEGKISMVVNVDAENSVNVASIVTTISRYYRYGGGPKSNMLSLKVDYNALGADFVRFTDSNGIEREYIAYVPEKVKESGEAAPLVVAYHGAQTSMRNFFENTLYYRIANSAGFIVVFPESTLIPVAPALTGGVTKAYRPLWQLENPEMIGTEEVYADELLDHVIAKYKVDENRIYCTGHSMGCMMTNYLGTSKVSDRFAACGATSGPLNGEASYDYTEAVPMFMTMAEYDMWPYDISEDTAVSRAINNWLIRNGLATKDTVDEVRNNPDRTWVDGRYNHSAWAANDGIPVVRYAWVTAKDHVNIVNENITLWTQWFAKWEKDEDGIRYYEGKKYDAPEIGDQPVEPVTEPEPTTEPVTEPETEPVTEPVTEPETEPVTEPATEPVTEPETEPVTEPVTEPETEPATEPATDAIDDFVERLYDTCLGRTARSDEIESWASLLKKNEITGAKAARGFFFSDEYKNSKKTDEEYVTDLYNTLMDREPDEAGLADWVGILEKGASREKAFAGFVNSAEFKAICEAHGIEPGSYKSNKIVDENPQVTAFVARMYTVALDRRFDVGGLEAWTQLLLDKKIDGNKAVRGFFMSEEFAGRRLSDEEFITVLYRAMFDREPDAVGMNNWLKALADGKKRQDVGKGFAYSDEFDNLCSLYGIIAHNENS